MALCEHGFAIFQSALSAREVDEVQRLLPHLTEAGGVRMDEQRKGSGAYDYLRELPPSLEALRANAYESLVPLASRFLAMHRSELQGCGKPFQMDVSVGQQETFPATLREFEELCRCRGQTRPSCLWLRYGEGGENRPHRDIYGDVSFPLQMLILLHEPGYHFTSGEFFTCVNGREHRAHMQLGDLLVFRTSCKHGCRKVQRGRCDDVQRHVVGLQFALRQLRKDRFQRSAR
eukprot:TRINITY_DN48500_c0_g1_i1.p1 TRINITY_DN48500_c0_g1~~TRINITY_DN48500_c0_g1_i1.p1  ORF type:complete len:249 (+),score=22.36 TRINITY_DN48500_c0_g1_i1:54-749(+)